MSDLPERFNLARYLLEDNLTQRADKVAVRSASRDLTYSQVALEAARVQQVLQDLGVGREARVLLILPDVPEFVTVWLGVLQAGAVFAMVNPRLPGEDYAYYLEYSRAPVAVVHRDAWEAFAPVAREARFLRTVLCVGVTQAGLPPTLGSVRREDYEVCVPATEPASAMLDTHRDELAGWLFTSGTSGKPKAAMHFHEDFVWNIERYARQVLQMGETDVTMAVSKLFFGYATGTNLMFPFAVGGQTALFAERSTPEEVARQTALYQPTLLAAVPTTLNGMLRLPTDQVKQSLASLRLVISAGEALPRELLETFQERFGIDILDGIGSAEMFHIYITNYPGEVKPGSLGRLVPGYEARVVGPEGGDVPVGEVGTLWVRGGSAALGYWLARETSRATFHGDWAISGDLFHRDAEGYFFYEGRADDLLKVGGIFVAPREVEECLLLHAAVHECCVVGYEEASGLTVPLAFVVACAGHEPGDALGHELQEHVKKNLAHYKYPRHIRWVESLPRNDRGKIARADLRTRAQEAGS